MPNRVYSAVLAVLAILGVSTVLSAAPPWTSLLPFKRVEANRQQEYTLADSDGPWLILAANFSGEGAHRQAQELVYELRKNFKLPAYMHRERFDFSERFNGFSHTGQAQRMKNAQSSSYDAYAVLIGDFPSIDDPGLERTLKAVKKARPACLDLASRGTSTQRFAGLRELYRKINTDQSKRDRGPMGNAFATRNPLLPKEYFDRNSVDDFVVRLNKGVKYSLLKNRGNVTVKVASFQGESTINMSKIADLSATGNVSDKLAIAADRAHRLTEALRKRNVEAYEFHDRHESIVTIGSFETEGKPLADGSVDINPEILKIMKNYGAARQNLPGRPDLGLQPRTLDGVAFDIQPMPMPVPRGPAGAYARTLNLFR